MRTQQRGFSLVEVMIVLGVISILGGIAVPSYLSYLTRTRVSEGVTATLPVKVQLADPFESLADLANAAALANARSKTSKFVNSVVVAPATGVITITFNENTVTGLTAATNTITLTPYASGPGAPVQLGTAVVTGSNTALQWGCASDTAGVANAHGTAPLVMGTVPAKYAPAECR